MPDKTPHLWKYSTKKARPNTWYAGEHPDHRYEYRQRVDHLVAHRGWIEYAPRCSCGWKSDNWNRNRRLAKAEWEKHLAVALRQTELFLVPTPKE